MISLSILNKMILSLLSLCLLGGCQKNPKTTHVADTSLAADTAEVEYYNSTKAPEWTWREGIKMDAYLLTSDAEHTMESTILNGSDTATLSFWIKPSTNVPDLPLISVVNEQQEMMKLTNLTAREDGTLQGMALQMKAEGQEQWLISNSEFTLNTHRYNQIVIVFEGTQATVYLNGQAAMTGQMGASINQIERKFNSMGGRAFIVTQSIKKLSDTLKKAVFNDYDYKLLSDDTPITIEEMKNFDRHHPDNLALYNDSAYKVVSADKVLDLGLYEDVVLKNGRTVQRKAKGVLKQRIIITFSRKMMEYQRTVRNRQIERAKKLLALKDPEEIKKGPNDVKRFMKRVSKTKSGEKVIVEYTLDESKIAEEEKYDGYYAIATNLADPAKDILAVSQKRYQIEDCFRIIKTNFDGRPVNHRLAERIRAHFLICYTALLVYRLLEAQLDDQKTHVTPANLVTTLKNMTVTNIHDIDFMALYKGSKTLDALTQLTRMPLDRRHYRPKDLNGMIKKFLS